MMRPILTFMTLVLMLGNAPVRAAGDENVYIYEKGQVIDFLYLVRRPNSDEAIKDYFSAAIPTARRLGYKPLKGFVVSGTPTQGNIYPNVVAVGGWPGDFGDRKAALSQLLEDVPDLHGRRMDIWSSFNMTNYEVADDIRFVLKDKKYYVLTSYWQKTAKEFSDFKKKLNSNIAAREGRVLLELTDGHSPFGYEHNPDYVAITEWADRNVFSSFLEESLKMDHSAVKHVNQFPITAPTPGG